MKAKFAAALAASIGLAGSMSASHDAQAAITEAPAVAGLQLGVGACLTRTPRQRPAPPAAGPGEDKSLGLALAEALVSKGMGLLGTALSKLGDAQTSSQTAARNYEGVAGALPQCLQVARGKAITETTTPGSWTLEGWPADSAAKLAANGAVLEGPPDFLFEAELVPSTLDPTVLAVQPAKVTLVNSIKKGGRGDRSIALFFAISPPGSKPNLATSPGAAVVLGALQPSTSRTFAPMGGAPPSVGGTLDAAWFSVPKADLAKPLTFAVLETETQAEDKFLKFVGSVLNDKPVMDAATEQVRQIVVPGAADDGKLKEALERIQLQGAANTAQVAAVAKLAACAASATPAVDGDAARTALKAYYEADRKVKPPANLIGPSQISAIDVSKPTVKAACQAALNALTT